MLQFLAFPDIKVGPEKRAAIFEALSLINEQLWLGHFEMWSGSGLVLFRHSTILDTRERRGAQPRAGRSHRRSRGRGVRAFLSRVPVRPVGREVAGRSHRSGADRHARGSMSEGPRLPAPTWFVGCGNMGGAILDGWRSAGIDLSGVAVIRPSGTPVEGVRTVTSAGRSRRSAAAGGARVQAAEARRDRRGAALAAHVQDGGRIDPRRSRSREPARAVSRSARDRSRDAQPAGRDPPRRHRACTARMPTRR